MVLQKPLDKENWSVIHGIYNGAESNWELLTESLKSAFVIQFQLSVKRPTSAHWQWDSLANPMFISALTRFCPEFKNWINGHNHLVLVTEISKCKSIGYAYFKNWNLCRLNFTQHFITSFVKRQIYNVIYPNLQSKFVEGKHLPNIETSNSPSMVLFCNA